MSCFVCGFCIGWCVFCVRLFAFEALWKWLLVLHMVYVYVVLHGDAFSIPTQVYALVSYTPKKMYISSFWTLDGWKYLGIFGDIEY